MKLLKCFVPLMSLTLVTTTHGADVLKYVLKPGSTITPLQFGAPSGPTEALSGTFDWIEFESDSSFVGFDATSLDFRSASFRIELNTTVNDEGTSVFRNSCLTYFGEIVDTEGLGVPVGDLSSFDSYGCYSGSPDHPSSLSYPDVRISPVGGGYFAARLTIIAAPLDTGCAPDTSPPHGSIISPNAGTCFGPQDLPVIVKDDFVDECDADPARSYQPGPGPSYESHGDHEVTLTVTDTSNNATSATVDFTIDTKPPVVELLAPVDRTVLLPNAAGFTILFHDSDDDDARGGVVHEAVTLQGCTIYDGLTYGNRDGLLSDETLNVTGAELCRLAALCGFTSLSQPELRVEATDCGGNVGVASHHFAGNIALRPGICGN